MRAEVEELFEVFALLRNPKEAQDFLTDLLTPEEIERFAVRWQIMKLSVEGLSRGEIQGRVGASLGTISRARRVVKRGTGMIRILVERLEKSRLLS